MLKHSQYMGFHPLIHPRRYGLEVFARMRTSILQRHALREAPAGAWIPIYDVQIVNLGHFVDLHVIDNGGIDIFGHFCRSARR